MSLPGLAYPLVGLADSLPGRETWDWFWGVEDFSICEAWRLKARPEMLIVDSEGRCWRISSVRDLGAAGNFRTRVLRFLVRQSLHRLDQVLVPLPLMTFGDFQRRLCAAIQNNPDYWRDDEAIAGEDAQPREEQDLLDELKAQVMCAGGVPDLVSRLWREDLSKMLSQAEKTRNAKSSE